MKKKKEYGEFLNVKLTDEEYEKLKVRFPDDYDERIDDLSYYIDSKGDKYKSHYSTILLWDRRDKKRGMGGFSPSTAFGGPPPSSEGGRGKPVVKKSGFNNFTQKPIDYEAVKKRNREKLLQKWGGDLV